jgi:hypothetical protein
MNWRLIRSMIKWNLMFFGGIAAVGVFLNWAINLPRPWPIVVIFGAALILANTLSYIDCEAQRKHIAACKKKGIKPTILMPM